MNNELEPGLGELLRHLTDLVDRGAEEIYRARGLSYRPRYTPVMRALSGGACTINEITARVQVTQGAVSQTVKLMEADGLLSRRPGRDARQTTVSLTGDGIALLETLRTRWDITFRTIAALEDELGVPLRRVLGEAISALEKKGFAERLREAGADSFERTHETAN